ncbi:hypothetical protein ACWC09_19815 [Streptomyces sp. NPDC001617]
MANLGRSHPTRLHQLLSGVFADWSARAGVFSALPDAPVVAAAEDRPEPAQPARDASTLAPRPVSVSPEAGPAMRGKTCVYVRPWWRRRQWR